jgi:hypothetical protein
VNEIEEKDVYTIGFVGDIMKMKNYKIEWGNGNIKRFFKGVDLIVGNLEGNIIDDKTVNVLRQKHNSDIFKYLSGITDPTPNWLLCISNNHSADFKPARFFHTKNQIDDTDGFQSFGDMGEQPKHSPRDGINIVSGTMWSNYKNTVASQFRDINSYYEENAFNILYPHWHYENECYVRRRLKKKCKSLFKNGLYYAESKLIPKIFLRRMLDTNNEEPKWDLVVGHHTHVPQPIVIVEDPDTKIKNVLAYSGGNFTSSKWIDKHQHGLILKCQIAKVNSSEAAVRSIEWSYTKCDRNRRNKVVTIDIAEELNKKQIYDFRAIKVLKNLLIVSICYLIFTPLISYIYTIPYWTLFLIFIRTLGVIGVQFLAVWLISRLLYKYKK